MLRYAVLAGLLALPAGLAAQTQSAGPEGRAAQRVRNVALQGNEKCPVAQGDEIVVCSRINPEEQFRIPKELRDTAEPPARDQAWANRTVAADRVGRVAAGLPDTCSPVGGGGQSGCALAANHAFAAEKRAAEKNDSMIPGGR